MIRDEVIGLIEQTAGLPVSCAATNLYRDLGIDSLSFVRLLLDIENRYSVNFDITEMEACLDADCLIALIELKVKEKTDQC